MTDRELLELAAKAAGYNNFDSHAAQMVDGGWDPLSYDGDALKLAVKLQLLVNIDATESQATDGKGVDVCEPHQASNANIATRRAIVRAAAEVGKAMK